MSAKEKKAYDLELEEMAGMTLKLLENYLLSSDFEDDIDEQADKSYD